MLPNSCSAAAATDRSAAALSSCCSSSDCTPCRLTGGGDGAAAAAPAAPELPAAAEFEGPPAAASRSAATPRCWCSRLNCCSMAAKSAGLMVPWKARVTALSRSGSFFKVGLRQDSTGWLSPARGGRYPCVS